METTERQTDIRDYLDGAREDIKVAELWLATARREVEKAKALVAELEHYERTS